MTVFREWQGRLQYLGNRLIRHLFSIIRWVAMIRTIEPGNEPDHVRVSERQTLSLRQAQKEDFPALLAAYPEEFSGHLNEALKKRLLMSRIDSDIPCFIAVNPAGQVCAGTWCLPRKDPIVSLSLGDSAGEGVLEIMNTFVVPSCRGQGLGQALRRYALSQMAGKGYRRVVSYIWYSRRQSIAMNFATGSSLLGEKSQISLLGWRGVFYRHRVNLARLPLSQKPGVLLVGDRGPLRRNLRRCFRQWGISIRVVNLSQLRSRTRLSRTLRQLEENTGSVPLVFCMDCKQRKQAETLIAESSLQATFPENLTDRFCAEDMLVREQQECGVVGAWYLSALGFPDRLMLWSRNETMAPQKGHNV